VKPLIVWQVKVTRELDEAVERAIRETAYVSKSDLIREAVREKLVRMGLVRA
jgi:Arc/MetJ-type ribon-helix-helix transcriptional regulator